MAQTDAVADSMTPAELAELLSRLGLSQATFARLLGVDRGTPNHWLAGRVAVPPWAALYLRTLATLRDLCQSLPKPEPAPVPARLQGLTVGGAPVLREDKNNETDGIAFVQHAYTIEGMDNTQQESMTAGAFKEALQALGWNQSQFARKVGCTVPTASRWANGAPIPAWVPVVLGLLQDVHRLHVQFVQPSRGKADSGP